jgi:antiviral helicase SKI2
MHYSYNKAKDAMMKRKEQVDKATGNTNNARGGRGGRGGAMNRGGGRTMTRNHQSSMQTVSAKTWSKNDNRYLSLLL